MDKYEKGKGLNLQFKSNEINNLYRLVPHYKIESFDFITLSHFLQEKKFAHIFLKELFSILKPNGFLIINYSSNKEITFEFLEYLLWWLMKGNYSIEIHEKKKNKNLLVVKKRNTSFNEDDSIEKWSFGIVTNGERDDWIDEIIRSIRNLKIPQYEILICGKYKERNEKDCVYIEFNERSEKGWITKKKNLIAQKALYQNLCIIHDRLLFDKDWYKGMKKYGNTFELLGCVQKEKNGSLAGDWLTLNGPVPTHYRVSRLHYFDWHYYVYLSGQFTIIKKNIWEKVLWDETRYWNDAEDADITFRARDMGYITRFNPYSTCIALSWRHGALPLQYDITEGLLPKDMYGRRIMRTVSRIVYSIPGLKAIMLSSYSWVQKTPLYKYLIYN